MLPLHYNVFHVYAMWYDVYIKCMKNIVESVCLDYTHPLSVGSKANDKDVSGFYL